MKRKVIIVGGVAGGASAAARLRRLDEECEIILLERGEYVSFANCGLPYYIGGAIKERNALLVQTVEAMSKKFNLDIRIFNEAVEIKRDEKKLIIRNLSTDEAYEESYDYLVLSPGASPVKPPIPGIAEADNIFTLRNIPDTDAIKSFVDDKKPQRAVVVGGGFIGVEMVENLKDRGIEVTLVEMADQIMAPIDFEMAAILHQHLAEKGVNLILSNGIKEIKAKGTRLVLQDASELSTDMIILAIGVKPENQLAKAAGLDLGAGGGIVVNEYLQTNDADIFAIGDVIQVKDGILNNPTIIPLAGPANKQGRIVANNIVGHKESYKGTIGSAVAKVFDMTVASTGNNEKTLKKLGVSYEAIHIHPGSHASYYPGAFPISLKIIFDRSNGKILGAQAIGYDGVEKRIDVIATAIKGNLTVEDLKELELTYAPPYSSAKDPVNMLGFVASNMMKGYVDSFQWHEVQALIENNSYILDVREAIETELGTIDGSVNIPLGELRSKLNELPRDKTIYIYCQVGLRGYIATRLLMQKGFKVKNLDGGLRTYQMAYGTKPSGNCCVAVDDSGVANISCNEVVDATAAIKIDACGLQCPGPILKVYKAMEQLKKGDILEITATDPGFTKDIEAWCRKTGNRLIETSFDKKAFKALIQKAEAAAITEAPQGYSIKDHKDQSTIVVFSQDLDKALAAFIIASGSQAMGKKVTLFFTFWGLNILRKDKSPYVEKSLLEKMFGGMMPKGPKKLPISNMNMVGMGPKMIKYVMKTKNVDSLELLMKNAMDVGVKLVACAMSMDIMGIKPEELMEGVEIGGVASYLASADDSGLNLFI